MGRALNGFSQSQRASQWHQNHLKRHVWTERQWFSITQVSEAAYTTQNKYDSGVYCCLKADTVYSTILRVCVCVAWKKVKIQNCNHKHSYSHGIWFFVSTETQRVILKQVFGQYFSWHLQGIVWKGFKVMSRFSTSYEHSSSNVNTTFIQSDQVFNNAVKTLAQKHLKCFSWMLNW